MTPKPVAKLKVRSVIGAQMTTFTPGPWTVDEPSMGFSQITGPNGELIFGLAAGLPKEKQHDDICAANARLIEAAPEMAEALRAIMGGDDKLKVAIGGNPIYVDAFLDNVRDLLARLASKESP